MAFGLCDNFAVDWAWHGSNWLYQISYLVRVNNSLNQFINFIKRRKSTLKAYRCSGINYIPKALLYNHGI